MAVSKLLSRQAPVYYVEDRSPPFMDSLAILQRHFLLEPTQRDPKVYRVLPAASLANQDAPPDCPQ